MTHYQTKNIQLFSANSVVRKFRVVQEVPIERTWMEVVQMYFLENIHEEFRSEERMYNELGLSCNSKAILWDDTVAVSMRRDKIGVRSDTLKVNIRKRLNSLGLTPHRRNELFYNQQSLDQYDEWGRHSQIGDSEEEEAGGDSLQSPSGPPPSHEPVAGPSSAMGLPAAASTPRRVQFEQILKLPPCDESVDEMPNEIELLQRQECRIQSVSSLPVRKGRSPTGNLQVGGERQNHIQVKQSLVPPRRSNLADEAIVEKYRANLARLAPEQILRIHDSVQFFSEVVTEDFLSQTIKLRDSMQLLNSVMMKE